MLDGNLTASAEANGVKVGDITNSASLAITNNFNVSDGDSTKPPFIARVIASVRNALDPAGCAQEIAEARRVKAESDIELYGLYRRNMSWLSDRQAFLYASGFVTTPTQADNVFAVFDAAESKVAGIEETSALPASVIESVVEGAKGAYDDDMREMWASVLAGEMECPGSVSKRTMSILGDMSQSEAYAFQKLCGCSIEVLDSDGGMKLIPLIECDGLEEFSLSRDEAESLDVLGLTQIHSKGTYTYGPLPLVKDGMFVAKIGDATYRFDERDCQFRAIFPNFTRYGRELANLCEPGVYPGFREAVLQLFGTIGFDIEELRERSG